MTKSEGQWRRVRLGTVTRVVGGATPSTSVERYWGGDIYWVTPTDLGGLEGWHVATSVRTITAEGLASCAAEVVPVGSVIMSSRAPIGYLGIAAVPLCTNQGCKTFVPGPEVDSEFLYFALRYRMPAIKALGSGATFAEVSKSTLEEVVIDLPPLADQRAISASLKKQLMAARTALEAVEEQLATIKSLPDSCLRAAFTRPAVSGTVE